MGKEDGGEYLSLGILRTTKVGAEQAARDCRALENELETIMLPCVHAYVGVWSS